jgi:hypothetical protein
MNVVSFSVASLSRRICRAALLSCLSSLSEGSGLLLREEWLLLVKAGMLLAVEIFGEEFNFSVTVSVGVGFAGMSEELEARLERLAFFCSTAFGCRCFGCGNGPLEPVGSESSLVFTGEGERFCCLS